MFVTAALAATVLWSPCGESMQGDELQCSSIAVPLNHSRPNGPTIALGLTRLRLPTADDTAIFVNGGGPGISGDSVLRGPYPLVPRKVAKRHTVVAVDPRGLPNGDPLDCLTPRDTKRITAAISDGAMPPRKAMRIMSGIGPQCRSAHVSSVANAYDLDYVRRALNQPRLKYVGASYGSYLGATYSHLFPKRVGRMVLGSVVHPDRTWSQLLRTQVRGYEKVISEWADTCHARDTCPFPRRDPINGLMDLIDELNASPKPLTIGQYSGQTLVLSLRDATFYGFSRKQIDETVREAKRLQASTLSSGLLEAMTAVQWATRCQDWPDRTEDMSDWLSRRQQWGRAYPVFGAGLSPMAVPCTTWPNRPRAPLNLTQTTRAVPLLINGRHDPSTPLSGARAMRDSFADARLAVWKGRGHGAIESGDCNALISAYLLRGRFVGKTCAD